MKYLLITSFFPDQKSFRGPFVFDQVKAINKNSNYEVIVMKPYSFFSHKEKDYEYNGVKVYRFPQFRLPSQLLPGIFDAISRWLFNRKLKALGIRYDEIKYCHCHSLIFGDYANYLKKKSSGIKTILQYHHFDVLALNGKYSQKYRWHKEYAIRYGAKVCKDIDLHIGVSNKVIESFSKYPEVKLKNTYTLYNGVDTTIFYPFSKKNKDTAMFHIGCIANFKIFKGHITLIRAVKELIYSRSINIKITLIGSGETKSECEKYCRDNNLVDFVSFKEEMQHECLPEFYNSIDLYVMPSYWETFGCVYTEAYACGVSFIACQGQGIGELLPAEDHSSWLVEPDDYLDLADKIEYYINQRPIQTLTKNIEIDSLISSFMVYLNELKTEKNS